MVMPTLSDVYLVFLSVPSLVLIDVTKMYNTVPRDQQNIKKHGGERGGGGVPEKYVRLVKNVYEGTCTKVKSSVGMTETLSVSRTIPGIYLNPYLYNLLLDVLIEKVQNLPFLVSKLCRWCDGRWQKQGEGERNIRKVKIGHRWCRN